MIAPGPRRRPGGGTALQTVWANPRPPRCRSNSQGARRYPPSADDHRCQQGAAGHRL